MSPLCSILRVLTIIACVNWREVDALVCKNGGTCVKSVSDECISCTCSLGFDDADCGTVLIKVSGAVTFSRTNGSVFNEPGFKSRISEIFVGLQSSSVQIRNSSSLSVVYFTVYLQPSSGLLALNTTKFQNKAVVELEDAKTCQAAFVISSGISVSSATVDIDECASNLYTCVENAECYNTALGYGCTCRTGFSETNQTLCKEIFCLLSLAPTWPNSASRNVTYANGTAAKYSDGDKMPYKTFIAYSCPERFSLVNDATGEPQAEVIECVGKDQATHKNSGWTGSNVRCDMTVEFMVAIVAAVISSAIIVLIGGALIVSKTNEKKAKAKEENDRVALEMENNF